jgi:putative ABC transport system permease protein
MILHNFKMALRKLKNNKLHAFLGITSFAVGFAVCIIIGLFIYNELTVDTCFKNHKKIFRVIDEERGRVYIDYNDCDIFLSNYPEIKAVCPLEMHTNWDRTLIANDKSIYMNKIIATNNSFFDMFSVQVVKCLSATPLSQIDAAVLTESSAKRLYGDENPLGKQIILDDGKELFINAIIKDFPVNTSIKVNMILNTENKDIRASHCGDGKGGWYYVVNLYLLLNENASPEVLTEKINNTIGQTGTRAKEIELQALTDIYLDSPITGTDNIIGNPIIVGLFGVIGLLILILSIINHINFLLSLQLTRLKEIGIKKTSGASPLQMISYTLIDVAIWIILSFLLSLMIVQVMLPFANNLLNHPLEMKNLLPMPIIVCTFLTLFCIVIITCLIPTIMLTKFEVRSFIYGHFNKVGKNTIKKILTTFQLSISIVLLIWVTVIQKQIEYAKHKNLGFNDEYLLLLELPMNYKQTTALKNQLLTHSSILSVSSSMGYPGSIRHGTSDKDVNGKDFSINRIDIDHTFLETIGINLIDGREFMTSDLEKSCLINETAYKRYGWSDLIGKKFQTYNVVGIVNDFHISSIHKPIAPISLVFSEGHYTTVNIRIRPENVSATMAFIRDTWEKISPNCPFKYKFYDDWFDAMYRNEERLSRTIQLFAIIAFFITCMGLLGQTYQMCTNRTKEIGIRKVLGATVSEIMVVLTKDFTKYVIIANIVAWPIAWLLIKSWLNNFAYRIELTIWFFLLSGVFTLIIALLTVSTRTIYAATTNPVESLRYE